MEKEHLSLKLLQTHLIKTTVASTATAILGAAILVVAFYFNTKNTLQAHGNDIQDIKTNQIEISKRTSMIELNVNSIQTNQANFKESVIEIKESQKEIRDLVIQVLQSQKNAIKIKPE